MLLPNCRNCYLAAVLSPERPAPPAVFPERRARRRGRLPRSGARWTPGGIAAAGGARAAPGAGPRCRAPAAGALAFTAWNIVLSRGGGGRAYAKVVEQLAGRATCASAVPRPGACRPRGAEDDPAVMEYARRLRPRAPRPQWRPSDPAGRSAKGRCGPMLRSPRPRSAPAAATTLGRSTRPRGPDRADLCGADLTGGDLGGARLTGADLSGADLTGANLADTDRRAWTWPGRPDPAELTACCGEGRRFRRAGADMVRPAIPAGAGR